MSLIDDLLKAPENITSIGFLDASDENESRLDVEFDNGVVYQIEGVPRDLYEN